MEPSQTASRTSPSFATVSTTPEPLEGTTGEDRSDRCSTTCWRRSTEIPDVPVPRAARGFAPNYRRLNVHRPPVAVILPDTTVFLVDALQYDSGSGYYG